LSRGDGGDRIGEQISSKVPMGGWMMLKKRKNVLKNPADVL